MTESFILPASLFIVGLIIISIHRKKMEIKIIKCKIRSYWYYKEVFSNFIVRENDDKNYIVIKCGCSGKMKCEFCSTPGKKYIEKNDCRIIKF